MKWAKIIILCCASFIISCSKEDVLPLVPPAPIEVFKSNEVVITNGTEISFDLQKDGFYKLVLVDKTTEEVIGREKINGVVGTNKLKFYTKSIQVQYLYLLLEDSFGNVVSKTTLIIK